MHFSDIFFGFQEIGRAFVADLSVWWVLTPVFILWIAMEFYFGEYKQEELGFSSALANGVSLTWVSVTSLRLFALAGKLEFTFQFIFLIFFLWYGVMIIWSSFTHRFPSRVMNVLASPSVIYFFSTLSVLWGQRLLGIQREVLAALLILFIIVYVAFFIIRSQLGVLGEIEAVRHAGEEKIE